MKITYRRMKLDDIANVYKVELSCFSEPWSMAALKDEIKNQLSRYIVAEDENENIHGYIGAWFIIDEAHITNVAVHKNSRGKGIGNGLIEELIKECEENRIHAITLEVRQSNMVAQNLYRKYGFLPGGIRKEYYSDNKEDAVIMWKQLKEAL
ncbi:ribosomal protein S18-alanine N-acetyltransferase [Peptostreptococcus canis]|uniref:ribosomal protein S18-alanine N-acetyltransferase n=1 Tax=Peptostreptococcus canis TaxID=1159213 RepID=UPI001FAD5D76|nr:ribosomal protein S18-alanine N-acetyltransferase [Peptostreptococcus canis]MBP1997713.1 ribosomal-protein-alanine N-acetyltransferase [Peptostreptococcus canis]